MIGAISISALPPFNGFVSEWLTFQAQLLSINLSDNITKILVLFSGAGLALTSALAAACFVKAFGISFLALPRSAHAEHSKEVPVSMLIGMFILSLMCIVLGVMPFYFIKIIDSISAPLVGVNIISRINFDLSIASLSPSLSYSPATISTPLIALLVFVILPLPIIMYLLWNRTPIQKYETWGCGQPVSTGRNEYTATAFSKPIRMWFTGIFRPHREIQTTYSDSSFIKEKVIFASEIEPIFEKYFYDPVTKVVITLSGFMRIIQTGYIQTYLLYILITLVISLIYVGSGG